VDQCDIYINIFLRKTHTFYDYCCIETTLYSFLVENFAKDALSPEHTKTTRMVSCKLFENAHRLFSIHKIFFSFEARKYLPLYENTRCLSNTFTRRIFHPIFFQRLKISVSKAILSSSIQHMCQTILKSRWLTDQY